jgi:hypothetical protein
MNVPENPPEREPTARCSGCGTTLPREDLVFMDEHTRYCASCLETL